MKPWLLPVFLCCSFAPAQAQKMMYRGKIAGKYEVEVELFSKDDKNFTGRYRYKDKTTWLELKGMVSGETQSHLVLNEYTASQPSGLFDLDFDGETLNGIWHKMPADGKNLGVTLVLDESEEEQ